MWTSVGQLSVFAVSTTPNIGLRARFAIPVLKAREVTSKIAVPVVSEPVPAVVGTNCLLRSYISGIALGPVLTCNERPQTLSDGETLAYGRVHEVHEVILFVDSESDKDQYTRRGRSPSTYKFAALAVSITLPPPTL
jgi:hypothetical protein